MNKTSSNTEIIDDYKPYFKMNWANSSDFTWSIFLFLFDKLITKIEGMKLIKISKEEVRIIYLVISTYNMPFEMKLKAEKILLQNRTFSKDFALSSLSLYKNKKFTNVFYKSKLKDFIKILIESLKNKDSSLQCLKIIFIFLEETLKNNSLYSIIGEINMIFSSEENLAEDKNLIFANLNSISRNFDNYLIII